MARWIVLLALSFCPATVLADGWPTGEEPTFGAEFTFGVEGSPEGGKVGVTSKLYEELCAVADCRKEGNKIYNPKTGFWFEIGSDIGVIECGIKPVTVSEFAQNAEWLQRTLFDPIQDPERLGFSAVKSGGGGHVSMDRAKSFGTNAMALHNAYVSFANFPILSEYVFGLPENWNARAVANLPNGARENVQKVIAEFQANPDAMSFETLHSKLDKAQQSGGKGKAAFNYKSHAMTLREKVYEFRGHLPQLSAFQFLQQITFYRAWALWVNSLETPIEEAIPEKLGNLTPKEVRKEFDRFLDMIGHNTEEFRQIYVLDSASCPAVTQSYQRAGS